MFPLCSRGRFVWTHNEVREAAVDRQPEIGGGTDDAGVWTEEFRRRSAISYLWFLFNGHRFLWSSTRMHDACTGREGSI